MHSSRMRTARFLPVSRSMHCSRRGVYLVPGGTGPRGVHLVPDGVPGPRGVYLVRGCIWSRGDVPSPGGCAWSQGGCTWSGGRYLPRYCPLCEQNS